MTTTTPITPKAKVPVKAIPPKPAPTIVVAASPAEQLKALAHQRADILEAITDAEAALRPLAEAGPDVRKLVQEAAARANSYAAGIAQSAEGWIDSLRALEPPHVPAMQFHEHTPPGAFPLLAAIAPEQAHPFLFRRLESSYRHLPPPLSLPQRTQRLTALRAQQAALETELTTVFWAAEAHGLVLPPPEIAAAAMLGLTP